MVASKTEMKTWLKVVIVAAIAALVSYALNHVMADILGAKK